MNRTPLDPHSARPSELRARIDAERRGDPFLLYRDGEGSQVILELDPARDRVTIGRRATSDVALRWDTKHRSYALLAGWVPELPQGGPPTEAGKALTAPAEGGPPPR